MPADAHWGKMTALGWEWWSGMDMYSISTQANLADSAVDGPPLGRDAQALLAEHVGLETPARMCLTTSATLISPVPALDQIVRRTRLLVIAALLPRLRAV